MLGDRMRYVYRHLPISSAHSSRCPTSGRSGRSGRSPGQVLGNARSTLRPPRPRPVPYRMAYAEEIGLDKDRFCEELENRVYAIKVQEDFDSGIRGGVNGTPTFFLNGERYDGALGHRIVVGAGGKATGHARAPADPGLRPPGGFRRHCSAHLHLIALVWRNSGFGESYVHFWETELAINLGPWELSESLLHWINDGLMVIFFFVVGLEIKRELTTGELGSPSKAALPYRRGYRRHACARGHLSALQCRTALRNKVGAFPWPPISPFTLGILTMFGSRVPLPLKVFFTAMAIADDLGAILVIAVFYSSDISFRGPGRRGRLFDRPDRPQPGPGLFAAALRGVRHWPVAGFPGIGRAPDHRRGVAGHDHPQPQPGQYAHHAGPGHLRVAEL